MRAEIVTARLLRGIAVNLGGSLRRKKTAGAGAQPHIQAGLVTRYQPAAETTEVGRNTGTARTGNEHLQRSPAPHFGHGALAGNHIDRQSRVSSHTVKCSLTMSSLRWLMGPFA